MADFPHLEKMGRELKCPICLSLLKSAVSLTCNHVFCNLCIEKSMKSDSSCPVCKVPYRRREVRPAPHMDNLVSIYKSMEIASGVNIFVTQTVPSIKLAEEDNQLEGGKICEQESGRTCQDTPKNRRRFKGKQPKKSLKTNQESSNTDPVKPSFPTKKRVQLPQFPPSASPIRPAMFGSGLGENTKNQPEKSSVVLKEKRAVNEKGEAVFTPFFWLRDEEDVEKLSQQTDGGHNLDTPPNAPCFSDIKDSDDEIPSGIAPKEGTNIALNDANYFDSEMFEWTQRPCSPELCSSPINLQVADTDEFNGIQEKECKASSQGAVINGEIRIEKSENVVSKPRTDNVEGSLIALSLPRTENINTGDRMKKSKKRGRKASEITKKKQTKSNMSEVLGVPVESQKVAENSILKQNLLNLNTRTHKRDKKVMFDISAIELVPENISVLGVEASPLNQDNDTVVTDLPASSDKKESSNKSIGRRRDQPKRLKTHNLGSSKNNITQNQSKEDFISQLSSIYLPLAVKKNVPDLGVKTSKSEIKTTTNPKCDQDMRRSKKQKIYTDEISKDNKLVDAALDGCNEVTVKKTQLSGKVQGNSEVLQGISVTEKSLRASEGVVFYKCDTDPHKVQCAFCRSTKDSEVSGIMVHYLNGKPVSADYNGGSKVIHAHKNCTEWAPNVYFEDDNAINLEAELARSRRIKCCCCDIKGAALGCYEKSCRKSFHVPCAKLIPQCQWDNDNFVMLCPLHASSKLPNEKSGTQIKRKKKCIPKGPSPSYQPEVAVKHASSTCKRWSSHGSSERMVLCCSALANAEREFVSEFERSSKVMVLKNWDSSVTHVIASTDENGACRRTLKVLMGILEGKWILNIEWIKASMKAMEPVDEQLYEIGVDIHGIKDGPRLGRLRVLNKQPKLFNGFKFYFAGDFVTSYKGYLHDLITAAGGTVLQRKPIPSGHESLSTFIIYSRELPDKCDPSKRNLIFNTRQSDAKALASSTGATVASNSWVLNSIAACKLQNLAE
ncbi:unnamed protein product [Camellia sinensis]